MNADDIKLGWREFGSWGRLVIDANVTEAGTGKLWKPVKTSLGLNFLLCCATANNFSGLKTCFIQMYICIYIVYYAKNILKGRVVKHYQFLHLTGILITLNAYAPNGSIAMNCS